MSLRLALLDALTGKLPEGLRFGMSAKEMEAALGHAAATSLRKGVVQVLKYGDVEFHFGPVGLCMIFLEYFEVQTGTVDLVVDAGGLRSGMSVADVEGRLLASGLTAAWHTRNADEGIELVIGEGGRLSFDRQDESGSLWAIAIHANEPNAR